ncbi:MAG: DUF2752 domain-containing protein [Nocardioidaceae bacterium]|nr:DUF2752 domain-containing protein [Nocardioidaceae bacterium]MCL2613628.1 DUF2752 domain-containing protein [Nocardioidaceae bacterium]
MLPPTLVVGGLAVATVALHLRDPHQHGTWGECPTYALFGIYCPGCGGLRAVNDLSNLQIGAAASSNLLFVLSLPFIAYSFLRWAHGRWTGVPWRPSAFQLKVGTNVLIVLLIGFTVLRNTPAGSWLAP